MPSSLLGCLLLARLELANRRYKGTLEEPVSLFSSRSRLRNWNGDDELQLGLFGLSGPTYETVYPISFSEAKL